MGSPHQFSSLLPIVVGNSASSSSTLNTIRMSIRPIEHYSSSLDKSRGETIFALLPLKQSDTHHAVIWWATPPRKSHGRSLPRGSPVRRTNEDQHGSLCAHDGLKRPLLAVLILQAKVRYALANLRAELRHVNPPRHKRLLKIRDLEEKSCQECYS